VAKGRGSAAEELEDEGDQEVSLWEGVGGAREEEDRGVFAKRMLGGLASVGRFLATSANTLLYTA
jgi:hypothetical protein